MNNASKIHSPKRKVEETAHSIPLTAYRDVFRLWALSALPGHLPLAEAPGDYPLTKNTPHLAVSGIGAWLTKPAKNINASITDSMSLRSNVPNH